MTHHMSVLAIATVAPVAEVIVIMIIPAMVITVDNTAAIALTVSFPVVTVTVVIRYVPLPH